MVTCNFIFFPHKTKPNPMDDIKIPHLHRQLSSHHFIGAIRSMIENNSLYQCIAVHYPHDKTNITTRWYVVKWDPGYRCFKTEWVDNKCVYLHSFKIES